MKTKTQQTMKTLTLEEIENKIGRIENVLNKIYSGEFYAHPEYVETMEERLRILEIDAQMAHRMEINCLYNKR